MTARVDIAAPPRELERRIALATAILETQEGVRFHVGNAVACNELAREVLAGNEAMFPNELARIKALSEKWRIRWPR